MADRSIKRKRRPQPVRERRSLAQPLALTLGTGLLVGAYAGISFGLQEGLHLDTLASCLVSGGFAVAARALGARVSLPKGFSWRRGHRQARTFTASHRSETDLTALANGIVTDLERLVGVRHLFLWLPPAGEPSFHLVAGRGAFPDTYVIPEFSLRQLLKTRPAGPWLVEATDPSSAAASFDELMRDLKAAACLPLVLHGQLLGLITLGPKTHGRPYRAKDLARLAEIGQTIAEAIAPYQLRAEQALHLSKLEAVSRLYMDAQKKAITDGLTGLTTHLHFQEQLIKRFSEARRFDHPMSLLFIDIDFFKRINDTYGHLTGDEVLRQVAATVQASARTCDTVARYGGEELAMLLPQTDLLGAYTLAERLRESIRGLRIPEAGGHRLVTVTASIGVAQLQGDDEGPADLLDRADRAVYEAKHRGRNQVILSAQGA